MQRGWEGRAPRGRGCGVRRGGSQCLPEGVHAKCSGVMMVFGVRSMPWTEAPAESWCEPCSISRLCACSQSATIQCIVACRAEKGGSQLGWLSSTCKLSLLGGAGGQGAGALHTAGHVAFEAPQPQLPHAMHTQVCVPKACQLWRCASMLSKAPMLYRGMFPIVACNSEGVTACAARAKEVLTYAIA